MYENTFLLFDSFSIAYMFGIDSILRELKKHDLVKGSMYLPFLNAFLYTKTPFFPSLFRGYYFLGSSTHVFFTSLCVHKLL